MLPFLSNVQVHHVALSLLHTLWQGALVAAVLWLLLRMIPARRANLRYGLCLFALFELLVSGLTTWGWLEIRQTQSIVEQVATQEPNAWLASLSTVLVWTWIIGMDFMLLRLIFSYSQVRQLHRSAEQASGQIRQLVDRVADRVGLSRKLDVLISRDLNTAAVLGMFRPVLFLPASMITGLSQSELEAVIAHELAHIRRFDAIVNFCQRLVEAILFYNPAVWWISRQIRIEREACCDAVGVQATGDAGSYSETLARWAESIQGQVPGAQVPAPALAFAKRNDSSLLDRVKRVLFPNFVPKSRFSPIGTLFLFLVSLGLLATLWKGTLVAVAIADELMPHEQVVVALTEKRNELIGEPEEIGKLVTNEGSINVTVHLETEDGKPLTDHVWLYYTSYHEVAGGQSTSTRNSTLMGFHPGDPLTKTETENVSWMHLLVSSKSYAPTVIKDIRADENGNAEVTVKLSAGKPSEIQVVDEAGDPVENASVRLSHILRVHRERKIGTGSRSSSFSTNVPNIATLKTDANGIVGVANGTTEPLFLATVTAPGFEKQSTKDLFGLTSEAPKVVTLRRALLVKGKAIDSVGKPISGAKIYRIGAYKKPTPNSTHYFGADGAEFVDKDFGKAKAVTSKTGEFVIDTLGRDSVHQLLCDAGEQGISIANGVRPGDHSEIQFVINGPINIRGTVTGDLERLKKKDGYHLEYGVGVVDDNQHTSMDSSGDVLLDVVDGVGHFELKNVVPGDFSFEYDNYKHCIRSLEIKESMDDLALVVPSKSETKTLDITTERTVRVNFHAGKNMADFRGRVSVGSRSKDSKNHFSRPVDVTDGVAEFIVNAPTSVRLELMDAPGFAFRENQKSFEVSDKAPDVFEYTVDVAPGGAVFGSIEVEGAAEPGDWFGVSGWANWRTEESHRSQTVSVQCDEQGHFYLPNLPYGSEVSLNARCGSLSKQLEPITIDAENPRVELNVVLEPGPVLEGRVVDEDGQPIFNAPLHLQLFTDERSSSRLKSVFTDRDGNFRFGQVTPDVGDYMLAIKFERDYTSHFVAVEDWSDPLEIEVPRGEVIEGRLLNDETGEPIADAEVFATLGTWLARRVYGHEAESSTDDDGRFRFSTLPPGEFELNSRVLHARAANNSTVEAGAKDVEFRVRIEPR